MSTQTLLKNSIRIAIFAVVATSAARGAAFTDADARGQVQADITALAKLKFENVSPNHMKYFGSNAAADLVRFFTSRVKSVGMFVPPAPSILAVYFTGDAHMAISSRYFGASPPYRWGVLFHEAFHASGSDHVDCPKEFRFTYNGLTHVVPFTDRKKTCDASDDGAYAIQFTLLESIAQSCVNCAPALRQQAARNSPGSLMRINDPAARERLIRGAVTSKTKNPGEFPARLADYMIEYRAQLGASKAKPQHRH